MFTYFNNKNKEIIILFICASFFGCNQQIVAAQEVNVNLIEKIDFSRLLSEHNFYTQKFIQSVFDNPEISVKLLNNWYYPPDRDDAIPILFRFKFEEMQICILSEYEYRIIWVKYDSDKKLNNKIKSLKKEVSRIISQVTIDNNTFKSHPNNIFSVSCLTDEVFCPQYIIWNNKNYIFVTQKLVARTLAVHVFDQNQKQFVIQNHTGQVGLSTLKEDEKRDNKLAQWLDFIPEETRQTFSSDQQNVCVFPTPKAGTEHKVSPEKIMNISPQILKTLNEKNKKVGNENKRK